MASFEGQAPAEFEYAAARLDTEDDYPFAIADSGPDHPLVIDWQPLLGVTRCKYCDF